MESKLAKLVGAASPAEPPAQVKLKLTVSLPLAEFSSFFVVCSGSQLLLPEIPDASEPKLAGGRFASARKVC